MELELKEPEYNGADRAENICRIWVHYKPFYLILGSAVFVASGIIIGLLMAQAIIIEQSLSAAMANLFPEAVGILFTVVVIDRLNDLRSQNQLKRQLIRELVSKDHGLAMRAFREMVANNWITDGSLKEADLQEAILIGVDLINGNLKKANLRQADLSKANLKNIKLNWANLYHTNLDETHLEGSVLEEANGEGVRFKSAYLWKAVMSRSHFENADFRYASLIDADLRGAYLVGADFRDANLTGAILKNAAVEDAKFNAKTKLPNGSFFNPVLGITQLNEFI